MISYRVKVTQRTTGILNWFFKFNLISHSSLKQEKSCLSSLDCLPWNNISYWYLENYKEMDSVYSILWGRIWILFKGCIIVHYDLLSYIRRNRIKLTSITFLSCVALAGLELTIVAEDDLRCLIFLPPLHMCWGCRCAHHIKFLQCCRSRPGFMHARQSTLNWATAQTHRDTFLKPWPCLFTHWLWLLSCCTDRVRPPWISAHKAKVLSKNTV